MQIEPNTNVLPETLTIETHNLCNRKCWFCKFGLSEVREKSVLMGWELIRRIVQNLKDFNFSGRLSWYRINEPLLDKRIEQIIEYSRKELPKSYLSLVTNGDLLTKEKLNVLFDSGLDSVGVSVYDEIAFEKFQDISFSRCILLDRRPKNETKFVESRGGNIPLPDSNHFQDKNCMRPSSMMNVTANGDVVLCSADFFSEVKVGSLRNQRIEDLWQSEVFKRYRTVLSCIGRSSLRLCSNCTYHGGGHERDYPETKRRQEFF